MTLIERVSPRELAAESGVQVGDQLVAVNEHDVSAVPAKSAMKLLSVLPYPKVLVFRTRVTLVDPKADVAKVASRTYNVTILHPPSLASSFQMRLADWSLSLSDMLLNASQSPSCPIAYMRSPDDLFGCVYPYPEMALPQPVSDMNSQSYKPEELIQHPNSTTFTMLSMLYDESRRLNYPIQVLSLGIAKRGVCTFVEKATRFEKAGAAIGLVVNTNDEVVDMPSGGENIESLRLPVGMVSAKDGALVHLTASAEHNEIIAVITQSSSPLSAACQNIIEVIKSIHTHWPRSAPSFPADTVLTSVAKPPVMKARTKDSIGGRLAVGGENGWALFDYHLALFGPQALSEAPLQFKMAAPQYGCDPSKYTVRITNYVVGIVRGGGCSFGIKIINAQKLGAKAVIIINNDNTPVLRLMVNKDELALITIPCVMVGRRFHYYVTHKLKPFYELGQFVVTLRNQSFIGEYDRHDDPEVLKFAN